MMIGQRCQFPMHISIQQLGLYTIQVKYVSATWAGERANKALSLHIRVVLAADLIRSRPQQLKPPNVERSGRLNWT